MRYRVAVSGISILFFIITAIYGQNILKTSLQKRDELRATYQKVARLGGEYAYLKRIAERTRSKSIKGGVLTFIEDISKELGLSDRIDSIKPVPGKRDVVEVVYRQVTLREAVDIFARIRAYSNLKVKTFSITRRFDNPQYAELRVQIEKI